MAFIDLRDRLWIGPSSLPLWAVLGAGALAYFLAAELGIALATTYDPVSPIWPAAGLAVAMVRYFGYRMWPAIAVGAFAANLTAIDPATALVMALGSTSLAVVGGTILRRLIERQSDTFILARTLGYVLAAGFGPMISATIGVGALVLSGSVPSDAFADAWLTWWIGDALGVLVVASSLLALRRSFESGPRLLRAGQATGLAAAVIGLLALVHASEDAAPVVFLAFPAVFIASRCFGPRGGTWTVLAFAIGLIGETVSGTGPFSEGSFDRNVLDAQIFLAVLAVSALVFVDLHQFDLRMPGAIFIAGAAIAIIVAGVEHEQAEKLEELRFRQLTETATERIREKTALYGNVMRSAASLFTVSDRITRTDWRNFVASLTLTERYPGIAGLGIVAPVKPDQLEQFIAEQRADGAPDFKVTAGSIRARRATDGSSCD